MAYASHDTINQVFDNVLAQMLRVFMKLSVKKHN